LHVERVIIRNKTLFYIGLETEHNTAVNFNFIMKNSGNIMEQQKGKIYLKLPCKVRVAEVLVRVHQLGLQNPGHAQQIQYFNRITK
jgi:Tfp pilus assembly protein PilO